MAQNSDVAFPSVPGLLQGGADGRRTGAAALMGGQHRARTQAQGRDGADVATGQQGVPHGRAVLGHGQLGQSVDPGVIATQCLDDVGLLGGVEGGEVDVADGGEVGAGLGSRFP